MSGDAGAIRRTHSIQVELLGRPRRPTFSLWLQLGFAGVVGSTLGCAPTVNIVGTYLPPSMVSAVLGLVASYLIVRFLARTPALRPLAQSALFFLSLTVIVGFIAWWSLFHEF